MKIVKGKLYYLILSDQTFWVLTSNRDRANMFFRVVFPEEFFSYDEIIKEENIYTKEGLKQTFQYVKNKWQKMGLLQAQAGSIKFNKEILDNLLDNNELILTNISR